GGGNADGKGTCFDTAPCFAENVAAADLGLDAKTCTLSLDGSKAKGLDPAKLNFAISTPKEGICGDWGCFVPLERDALTGWSVDGTTVRLPEAACSGLASGESLVASKVCEARQQNLPPCGDWNGVDGSSITVPLDELPPPTGTGGMAS